MKKGFMLFSFLKKKEKSEEELFEIAFKKLCYFASYMHLQFTRMGYQMAVMDYRECQKELMIIKFEMKKKSKRESLEKLIERLNLMNKRGFC